MDAIRRKQWLGLALMLVFALPGDSFAHPGIEERITVINKRIKKKPNDPMLYLKRGNLYREHGEWTKALEDFDQAESFNPNLPDINFYRARMWLEREEFDKAKTLLDAYTSERPNDGQGYLLRAKALAALESPAAAADDLSMALDLIDDPLPDLYIERAQLLASAGPDYRRQRREGLEDGLRHFGPLVVIIEPLVDIEINNGNYQKALQYIELLPPNVSSQAKWIALRGDIHAAAGDPKRAETAYRAAQDHIESLPDRRKNILAVKQLKERLSKKVLNYPDSKNSAMTPRKQSKKRLVRGSPESSDSYRLDWMTIFLPIFLGGIVLVVAARLRESKS